MTSTDIYTILSSKPHNPHYLKRYIKFIECCQISNILFEGYVEKHHICPKAKDLFPEYKDFKKYRWNRVDLSGKQHFVAHRILAKAYLTRSMLTAFGLMITNGNNKGNYEKHKIAQSLSMKNDNPIHKCDMEARNIKIGNSSRGRIYTSEQNERNSLASIEWHKNNEHPKGMLGKHHSQETLDIISLHSTGENNPAYGKVYCWNIITQEKETVSREDYINNKNILYITLATLGKRNAKNLTET
jgi:hypothetical protein